MNKSFWFLQTLFITVVFTITSLWLAFVAYGRWQQRESAETKTQRTSHRKEMGW